MQFNKKQGLFLTKTIQDWQAQGIISPETADTLSSSFKIRPFDWARLAKYSFWISIICAVIAVAAILLDAMLMELLQRLFHSSGLVPCIIFSILSVVTYILAFKRRKKFPEKTFSNEAIIFIGVLFTAVAVAFFGKFIDTGSGHYSLLFLLSTVIYAVIAFCFPSRLVWIFCLLSLGAWFGTETGYMSGSGAYFLGMNYPLRFILFGSVLVALSFAFKPRAFLNEFSHSTYVIGLLYLFIALWILSIFGNYSDLDTWREVPQYQLALWGVLFAAVALLTIFYGLKYDDATSRGFGITFLFINLYTRYFEYFWDHTHKAIFFIILAVSFWLIGRYAEKIWNLEFSSLENIKQK